jgi:hypothetical protein
MSVSQLEPAQPLLQFGDPRFEGALAGVSVHVQ